MPEIVDDDGWMTVLVVQVRQDSSGKMEMRSHQSFDHPMLAIDLFGLVIQEIQRRARAAMERPSNIVVPNQIWPPKGRS